jgi:predicted Fe-Mo cluster-binding NifX family protein
MKIAVSATGGDPGSTVDPRFGRARWFIFFDAETGEHRAHDNSSSADAASGAGVASAQTVIDAGAEVVLTGNCGPKATRTLSQGGVRIVEGVTGTVSEAYERMKRGEL